MRMPANPRLPLTLASLLALAALCPGGASAQTVYSQTTAVGVASVAPPSEFSFSAETAQALTVTLTDFQTPAAFASLQIAVTLGDTVVGTAVLQGGAATATVSVPAATGQYGLHVIGTPDASVGLGSFGACVAPASSPTACIAADSFSSSIQTPSATSSGGTSALTMNFTSSVAGTYTVTLTDDAFPVALSSVSAGIAQGSNFIAVNLPIGSTPVPLGAGTSYTLLVAAVADTTVLAGLYGVQITDPNGQPVFARTLAVGKLGTPTVVPNPVAQNLHLTLTDLVYPAPLLSLGAAVTSGAVSLTPPLLASGTSPAFNAPAGDLSVWEYPVATTQPGIYSIALASGSAALFSATRVAEPGNGVNASSFAYLVDVSAAGAYTVTVNDFQFPAQLQSLDFSIAQNGAQLTVGGSGSFTAANGPVVVTASTGPMVVLVNATPSAGTSGIYSVAVAQNGNPGLLLDRTQAVGALFNTFTVNLGVVRTFDVTLADLGFPTAFQNLAIVVSTGGQVVGKIYGTGKFPVNVEPGQYTFSFVATPGAQNYGLYAIDMAAAPPTVTLSANTNSIAAGQALQLTWSSQNASSCEASGASGWSGSELTSGSIAVALQANATLTLTCTGAGGTSSQSVSVTVTSSPGSSGSRGGGGATDGATVLALCGLFVLVRWRQRHFRVRRSSVR
jgi:hypothetical protein